MKHLTFLIVALFFIALDAKAQYGLELKPLTTYTPTTNQYNSTYTTPTYDYGTNINVQYQKSYTKSDGTYVQPHYKTKTNNTNWDNFSTKGNYNPYTGTQGTKARDYSIDAYNYGQGKVIYTGPRGGQYYYNSNGNKTYVPKR